ncbi:hypothetical protein CARUB_v10016229mg [Capsella rubella]|uniref:non-specific serine/threonine protein kinase n=3 Tax=Capsella rubella TaxID=81985 RepID=R0HSX4_9BRAS|nr:hypothetical protein CARUB_v10016229mg [Capsella rubella]
METPPADELLKKMLELEQSQEHLKQEMSRLSELRQPLYPMLPRRPLRKASRIKGSMNLRAGFGGKKPSPGMFTNENYLNILHSMAQSVHVLDLDMRIIFWNAMSEKLYGYSAAEVVGHNPLHVIVDDQNAAFAMNVARRCLNGESWAGEFPVKTKSGEIFSAVTTCSPFYDDCGSIIGIISITSDVSSYLNSRILKAQQEETNSIPAKNSFAFKIGFNSKGAVKSKLGLHSDQPIQVAIASKISNLASKMSNKVRSKMQAGDNSATLSEGDCGDNHHPEHCVFSATLADRRDDAASSGASTPSGNFIQSPFGVFTCTDEKFPTNPFKDSTVAGNGEPVTHKALTSKAEESMVKKGLSLPWKGYEPEGSKRKPTNFVWPWVQNEGEKDNHQINPSAGVKSESHDSESNKPTDDEASSMWSSINANSTSSVSSCGSTSRSVMEKIVTDNDCLEYEILWDDLTIGEQIGQGSCGTVYHGLWFGSDVAVKVFSKQEYSKEVIKSFGQEVSLMKRLRHPNVLLFMGAVTSPQRLCIVSEFVPRGSLFRLLQKGISKLDWRRRINMALDIARGMNYLHCCSPPIIHRDLKSSNLLVDRNWTVKVADFGLSRIKYQTYLSSKSGKGTPQWMAPEVLRNESADEKSDIYSFGVVLWELATEKIPWENLNSMQVIGAVGFMNQRLEIRKDIDPAWISLVESCWQSDTKLRPTFQELMQKLKDLQRKYAIQSQVTRAGLLDNPLLKNN